MTIPAHKVALAREYGNGLRDGAMLTLRQLLGDPGVPPDPAYQPDGVYGGELPDELREWAKATLARFEQVKP